jgi:3-oxoacyl-[acyl-carrier protein] reductase
MFGLAAESLGGLDILVINAGGSFDHLPVEESAPDLWLATLGVNLTGSYYCARTAILYPRERGAGKIITIGSGIGHQGRPSTSAKAGLWMLTRVLAQELWQYNISVNELVPGPVMTGRVGESYARRDDSVFKIDSD